MADCIFVKCLLPFARLKMQQRRTVFWSTTCRFPYRADELHLTWLCDSQAWFSSWVIFAVAVVTCWNFLHKDSVQPWSKGRPAEHVLAEQPAVFHAVSAPGVWCWRHKSWPRPRQIICAFSTIYLKLFRSTPQKCGCDTIFSSSSVLA